MDLMSNGNIQGRYTTKIQFSGTEQCYYNFDFQHLIDIGGVVEFLRNHCGSLSSFIFFSFSGKQHVGPNDIFATLSSIRSTLAGDWPPERLVHVVEKLQCRAHGQDGVAIRVSGSFIVGNQFLICGDGVQVEGLPSIKDLSIDISSKRMGTFQEQFIMEPSNIIGCYSIAKQELYIMQ